jgi:hypothetical protein
MPCWRPGGSFSGIPPTPWKNCAERVVRVIVRRLALTSHRKALELAITLVAVAGAFAFFAHILLGLRHLHVDLSCISIDGSTFHCPPAPKHEPHPDADLLDTVLLALAVVLEMLAIAGTLALVRTRARRSRAV